MLTFTQGKFRFDARGSKYEPFLNKNSYWTCPVKGVYETTHLREAAVFRRLAAPDVEKILLTAFQEHYELPSLPSLPLDPHQVEGIKWVLSRKRSYLAHAPGAGKTCEAIVAACLRACLRRNSILFIVPPSLVKNWEREIYKFTEWFNLWPVISIVPRSDEKWRMDWNADFIICPDSMLTKPWVYDRLLKRDSQFIAVDEASRFKTAMASRSLAFYGGSKKGMSYPGLFQKARHVVFLDGSPMPNRPMELWAPTYALHPQAIDCKTYTEFGYRYCDPRFTERGEVTYLGSSHEEELKEKLTNDFMHVVREDQLTHPERMRSILFMDEDARSAEHKSWEKKHLETVKFKDGASQGELARFRRQLGERKTKWIAKYVGERLKEKMSLSFFSPGIGQSSMNSLGSPKSIPTMPALSSATRRPKPVRKRLTLFNQATLGFSS